MLKCCFSVKEPNTVLRSHSAARSWFQKLAWLILGIQKNDVMWGSEKFLRCHCSRQIWWYRRRRLVEYVGMVRISNEVKFYRSKSEGSKNRLPKLVTAVHISQIIINENAACDNSKMVKWYNSFGCTGCLNEQNCTYTSFALKRGPFQRKGVIFPTKGTQ